MIAERAWQDLLIAGVLLVLSLAVMPWGAFLSHLSDVAQQAYVQAEGGTSAASLLPLAVLTAAALVLLGWRQGWYLVVPALWPANQLGYAVVCLPVLGIMPFVAAAIAMPVPYLGPIAIIATALLKFSHHGAQREPTLDSARIG